jgi:ubiquinone/menaquinone biosynthesis C-methylase UbiE
MIDEPFDQYAEQYDAWFLQNRNVLASEILLLARCLASPGKTLSVGCGSGLFEHLLRTEHGIEILHGVEPAEGMARIAEKRGMTVKRGTAESLPFDAAQFDTVLMNGIPSYVADLEQVFREAHRVLRQGAEIVVVDVPAESSYGLLYRLVAILGTYDDAFLKKVAPRHPYPAEFAATAIWRSTEEKADLLVAAGFEGLDFAQTLTRHPKFSDNDVEEPVEGFDRGDYVAIRARKAS